MQSTESNTLSLLKSGQLIGSKSLKICQGLTEFPAEIYQLAETLEILDLSGNALRNLPDDLVRLKNLRILFCSSNLFDHLPDVLGQLPKLSMIGFKANQIKAVHAAALPTKTLRWLILTDNAIAQLPDNIGDCPHMQKLMLAGNQLTHLPESLSNCKKLELLRISANRLTHLPDFLLSLPKLSWLAYAGNPFCDEIESDLIAQRPFRSIDWQNLKLAHKLGEGASGHIYLADWHQTETNSTPVAVKLFKAQLTSDGLPRCETHATALVGEHPNLLGLLGKISPHPDGQDGIVMPLLPANLNILANPPSFASCSRDVYPDDASFTLDQILNTITDIASAVAHIHQQGITHGDLYGHNILLHPNGKAILTDFGGASFLPVQNPQLSAKLQRIETLAFACLLEELLTHCESAAADEVVIAQLWQLQKTCSQSEVNLRPSFKEINQEIDRIKRLKTA